MGLFRKKRWKKCLCSRDKNYCYFCKSNIPVINLILDSRNMTKLSKNMSLQKTRLIARVVFTKYWQDPPLHVSKQLLKTLTKLSTQTHQSFYHPKGKILQTLIFLSLFQYLGSDKYRLYFWCTFIVNWLSFTAIKKSFLIHLHSQSIFHKLRTWSMRTYVRTYMRTWSTQKPKALTCQRLLVSENQSTYVDRKLISEGGHLILHVLQIV